MKSYVPSLDRRLRETAAIASPRLPPFSGPLGRAPPLNPLMVVLSGEIKFRRFLRDLPRSPFPQGLPADVMDLIHKTTALVALIYWKLEPRKGTPGYSAFMKSLNPARRNEPRKTQPGNLRESSDEDMTTSDAKMSDSSSNTEHGHGHSQGSKHSPFSFPEGASLERRIEIASLLMSGHGKLFNCPDYIYLSCC